MTNEAKRNEDTVEPLVRLSSSFTQIEMNPFDRAAAVRDAHSRTLSPHEWTWTPWQQARMALYVLWASQRIAAMRYLAEGRALKHEPEKRTACRDCGLPGPFLGGLCAGCADAMAAEEPNAEHEPRAVASRAPCSCSASGYDPECKWEGHNRV